LKQRLGQHFLFDPSILDRIVAAINPNPGERVLEIGPGRGTLTRRLLEHDTSVAAIEYDRTLERLLRAELPEVDLVFENALKVDWNQIAGVDGFKIIGNVPYNITSPLIDRALSSAASLIVFLVQAEVADRIVADPGTKAFGSLSVGVQIAAQAERLFTVRPGSFRPPPKVSSALIRLQPKSDAPPEARDPRFRRFVTDLFGQRRKQLARSLRSAGKLSAEAAAGALSAIETPPTERVENLSPETILRLFRALND
jgi:16S rRNA (adenine1518-N6/adenine1519-N6)-dimethyltransferase